jgi:hypothetical protein
MLMVAPTVQLPKVQGSLMARTSLGGCHLFGVLGILGKGGQRLQLGHLFWPAHAERMDHPPEHRRLVGTCKYSARVSKAARRR